MEYEVQIMRRRETWIPAFAGMTIVRLNGIGGTVLVGGGLFFRPVGAGGGGGGSGSGGLRHPAKKITAPAGPGGEKSRLGAGGTGGRGFGFGFAGGGAGLV